MTSPEGRDLDAVLAGLEPVDERERESIVAFGRALVTLGAPFDEHADDTHVTASAVVVSDDAGSVALHLHKRLGIWLQPGGHIEPGETPASAALREAGEEIGIPLRLDAGSRVIHVDVHPGPRGHTHLDLRYLLRGPRVPPRPAPGESPEVRWFGWDEALGVADAGLMGALRRARGIARPV